MKMETFSIYLYLQFIAKNKFVSSNNLADCPQFKNNKIKLKLNYNIFLASFQHTQHTCMV